MIENRVQNALLYCNCMKKSGEMVDIIIKGLQLSFPSKLNPDVWAQYLGEYWDLQLFLLIKYGFP